MRRDTRLIKGHPCEACIYINGLHHDAANNVDFWACGNSDPEASDNGSVSRVMKFRDCRFRKTAKTEKPLAVDRKLTQALLLYSKTKRGRA